MEIRTWFEGEVTLPWRYRKIKETNEYRNRTDITKVVDQNIIKSTFLSFDEKHISRFLLNHVPAIILGLVIETDDPKLIPKQIEDYFGPTEIIGILEIDDNNRDEIEKIMLSSM